ncbi:carboxypeptidase-like regulatory domain-containing protein, partial [bacterium]|nr:carboxypeptidase-like regulatory domain-containing protein [bacterium]
MSSVTMLRIMKVGIFIVLTMMFLITPHSTSQAATTGKIVGKVTDSSSGEPIANASIVLSGKQWGTASDLDGNYAILNLPPALYGVQVSSLGFHTLDIKDVYIASDLTTELNIKLTPNVLELKEAVIIFEPPQIELGGSSQKKRFDKATLEALQPASVTELISVTKGFKVDEEDKWHVRGSRSGDVAVIVEGVDLRDPLVDTQFSFNLSSEAIDEVNVLTGGFAAEYGRVMGGIVQITTSEGKSDNYSGRIEIETDRVIDTYSFDADNVQLAVGGPVPFTKFGDKNPMTFYLTGMTKLTNTYVPFNVQREANDYLKFGINLPERQNNEFQSSLKLAYNLNPSKKLTLYLTEAFRMWDIYPSGEGNISGNYGYGYKHNIDNRPYASNQSFTSNLTYTDQLSSKTFYEVKLVVFRTHSKVQPRGKTPGDFTMLDDIEDDFAIAADRNLNKYLERDEYLDSDGDGFMDGFMDANANGIFDGGGEGYEDLNYNGRWDRGEDWVDLNGNGVYDSAEPWIDVVNPLTGENNLGYFDSWDTYTDLNENGRWDPSEPQLPEQDWNGNGRWDGERFIDAGDKDKKYTPWEAWEDDNNNYLWDPGEVFTDVNGNGVFDYSEGYDDVNKNGKIDKRDLAQTGTGGMFDPDEPFIDGDFWWDTGEPFIDEPDPIHGVYNGRWDPGEVWFDLPSSSNQQTGAGLWFIGTERSLNGQYDPPNGMFDEYELFTRPTDWNFNSDRTRPVLYNFREELRGSDWPSNIFDVLYFEDGITPRSTWINRTIHDTNAPTFDMRNFNVEEDKEWYLDYNNNGEWNRDDGFLNPGIWDPNAFWQDRISTEYTGKFDLQSQVTEFHEMKVGFEIRYRMLEMQTIQQPDKAYSGEAILPDGSPWPERGGDRDFYEYNP